MNPAELAASHLRALGRNQKLSLREFAESPLFCNLVLSPRVREVMEASAPFRIVAGRVGGRGGKTSRLLAPKALHAAWTVPLPTLNPGEVASSMLIAPDMKLGKQTLSFVKGYVEASPILREALVKDPTNEDLVLKRPDGKLVRVEVLAATRGGRGERARTLVFVGMDEACFFYSADTGVVNDQDIFNAVFQRVVPGGQVWVVSTPWLKNVGLLEKLLTDKTGLVYAFTGGTRAFNPTWDPDGVIERAMRATEPDAAIREIDGEPLGQGAQTFFDEALLQSCIDASLERPVALLPGDQVCGGADTGFVHDACAGCATVRRGAAILVAGLKEVRPTSDEPLKPSEALGELATFFKGYAGLAYIVTDAHYRESFREVASKVDLSLKDAPNDPSDVYLRCRVLMREGRVKLPPNQRLLSQLRSVMSRANAGGSISIILPRGAKPRPGQLTAGHCDLVSAFVLAVWESAGLEVPDVPTVVTAWEDHWKVPDRTGKVQDKLEAAMMEKMAKEEYEEKWGEGSW